MGIHKASASALHQSGENYVVVPAETIELLDSADALAILLYLLNKPRDWQIQPADIMKQLKMGRPRQEAAFRELARVGLLVTSRRKGIGGKFVKGADRDLFAHPSMNREFGDTHSAVSCSYGGSIPQENHSAENPSRGKPAPLHMYGVITHEQNSTHGGEKPGEVDRRRTRDIPLDEQLTDRGWAEEA